MLSGTLASGGTSARRTCSIRQATATATAAGGSMSISSSSSNIARAARRRSIGQQHLTDGGPQHSPHPLTHRERRSPVHQLVGVHRPVPFRSRFSRLARLVIPPSPVQRGELPVLPNPELR
jgi:hypothetical protein